MAPAEGDFMHCGSPLVGRSDVLTGGRRISLCLVVGVKCEPA